MAEQLTLDPAMVDVQGQQTGAQPGAVPSEGETGQQTTEAQNEAKRIADLQEQLSKFQSRADKLESENRRLNDTVLSKLTEAATARQQPVEAKPSSTELQAQYDAMLKKIDDEGAPAIADYMRRVTEESEAHYAKRLEEGIAKLEDKYAEKFQSVTKTIRDRDPEYLARKEDIHKLAEELDMDPDTDRDILIKFHKKMRPTPTQPGRPQVPAYSQGAAAGVPDIPAELTPEEREGLESVPGVGKLTPQEAAYVAAQARKRSASNE